jgi:nucleoside-diphosphate-sugar epimerase
MTAANAVGRSPRLVSIPARPMVLALRTLERFTTGGPIRAEQIERLLEDKAFDITEARRDLGFAPRAFAEGIHAEAAE